MKSETTGSILLLNQRASAYVFKHVDFDTHVILHVQGLICYRLRVRQGIMDIDHMSRERMAESLQSYRCNSLWQRLFSQSSPSTKFYCAV